MSLVLKNKYGNLHKMNNVINKKKFGKGFRQFSKDDTKRYVNNAGGILDIDSMRITHKISMPISNNNFKPISREQEERHGDGLPRYQKLQALKMPSKKLNNLRFEL